MNNNQMSVSDSIDGKDAVGLYLESISRIPLLTADEEVALGKRIEAGLYAQELLAGNLTTSVQVSDTELSELIADGKAAMKRFVTANLRLVVAVARKFNRGNMPLLDLIQEGNTGLIRAVEKFDYAKGFKFSTYATWWIRQSITRGLAQQGRIVKLPVHVAELVSQISATRRNLERELDREPTFAEIAKVLELEEEKVVELSKVAREHVSLDAPVDSDGDTALGELIIVPEEAGPTDEVVVSETQRRLDQMLDNLDERSADVVRRRFGLYDGRAAKLSDIGEVWGITAERVRQIERQALKQLREQHELAA